MSKPQGKTNYKRRIATALIGVALSVGVSAATVEPASAATSSHVVKQDSVQASRVNGI